MRQMQLLLLLAFLLAADTLCAQSKAVIRGKIQKSLSQEVIVASYPSPLLPEEVQLVAKLENGRFELEIPITQPTLVELVHGNEEIPVYLEPGYELQLSLHGQKLQKSAKFKGKGAAENNFLSSYNLRFDEEEDYQPLPDNIKLREQEFLSFLKERREDQLAALEKYTDSKTVSETFRKVMLAEIAFSYANDRLTYFSLREQVIINDASPAPSAAYYTFLQELNLNQPENLTSISFTSFMRNYVAYLSQQANLSSNDRHFYRKSYDLVSQRLSGESRTMAQAHLIRTSLQQGNVLHAPAMLQHFGRTANKPLLHASLTQLLDSYSGLGIGSAAPDFKLKDVDGNEVSLQDFRGKVIYLGFWRTNCGLCMIEQPHAQELARRLAAHDVVVMHIGVDEDERAWRQVVESRGRFGVQLHLKGQGAELVKQYGLKDVPAYFLIDETGSIISTKPRRPNDREVENDILQHVTRGRAYAK